MAGTMVEFQANGHRTSGYLALPPAGRGPALVVIQEWWGLVPHITDLCDRFAAEGFVALAPDLYHGKRTTSPDEAGKLFMALDIARASQEIRGAATHLLAHPAAASRRAGVLGFCMGGQLALHAAMEHPDVIGCAVDFYGVHPNVTIDPARLTVPVLAHFGEHDRSVPVAEARALVARCREAGCAIEAHVYDAGHAFFNDTRPQAYDAAAARLAWTRTLAFLRTHLPVTP